MNPEWKNEREFIPRLIIAMESRVRIMAMADWLLWLEK